MSRLPTDQTDRMLTSDATEFERRVLEAARQRRPSAAASARMAKALGLSSAVVGATAATAAARVSEAAAAKASAATATAAVWPWVSAGVLGLAIAGAVIGGRATRDAPLPAAPPPLTAPPPVEPEEVPPPAPARRAAASGRARPAANGADLGAEVALIDAARDAIASDAARRALDTVRRYQEKYPNGTFRPEAGAIKIEALMKLGRAAEARALAERFVAEHRGSLLARRVADVVGLGER
jgi:hypothetical protein